MTRNVFPSSRAMMGAALLTVLTVGVMLLLRWQGVASGELVDWLVGLGGFWWLMTITVVPWNLYFAARAVQNDIVLSERRGIETEVDDARFVQRAARRSLQAAFALHGGSALGFAALAYSGVTPVGWVAAAAALALTGLRPAARLYVHVAGMLGDIGQRTRFPRRDVQTLQQELLSYQHRLDVVEALLDPERRDSWAAKQVACASELTVLEHVVKMLREQNSREHEQLGRHAEKMAQRLGEDAAFLGNVRELIRFVKTA